MKDLYRSEISIAFLIQSLDLFVRLMVPNLYRMVGRNSCARVRPKGSCSVRTLPFGSDSPLRWPAGAPPDFAVGGPGTIAHGRFARVQVALRR